MIENIEDAFSRLGALVAAGTLPADAAVYAIANYTALPQVHAALNAMEAAEPAVAPAPTPAPIAEAAGASAAPTSCHPERSAEGAEPKDPATSEPSATPASLASEESPEPPVIIAHMLPDLLNLYGDGGNVRILEQRLRWRGIPVEVRRIQHGEAVDFSQRRPRFHGRRPRPRAEACQRAAAGDARRAGRLRGRTTARCWPSAAATRFSAASGCGATSSCPASASSTWRRAAPARPADRLIDNMVLESPLAAHPVVGYENHAGRTYLGEGVEGFGRVVSSCGHGNNDDDRVEGARYKNVVGTYSHGPLLSKNPEVADWLLARALERRAGRTGTPAADLAPLDDGAELAANASMVKRLS